MARQLGDAFVRVRPDTSDFQSETSRGLSSSLKKVAGVVAGALASREVIRGAKALVDRASDLSETGNKINVVFGGAERQVKRFAKGALTQIGQTQQSVLDAASTFGVYGKAAGLSERENAKFSKSLVGLSSDLASFYNASPEEVIAALGSGLRGEAEPLRKYGVLLDDATLKAEAMAIGILKPVKDRAKIQSYHVAVIEGQKKYNEAVKEHGKGSLETLKAEAALGTARERLTKATEGTIPALTQQQKVLAAQSSIMKQTKDAQGDFGRTSGGLANQQRILAAQSETLKTAIGKGLLPVFQSGAQVMTQQVMPPLISLAEKWVPRASKAIEAWINGADVPGFFERIGDSLKGIDWSSASASLGSLSEQAKNIDWTQAAASTRDIAASAKEMAPVAKDLGAQLPGINDLLTVTGEVMGFAADHTDLLVKALPYLVGGFIAVKVAQLAANVVAVASPAIRIAEVIATRAQTKAIVAQTAALKGATVAQVTNGVVTGTTTRATIASRVAALASAAATRAVAVATTIWTGAQKLLNVALRANPIGLVITAVALLVTGMVVAYKKSETFRNVVDGAFKAVAATGRWLWNEALQPVFKLLVGGFAWLMDMFGKALDAISKVPGFGWAEGAADKMRGAAGKAREMAERIRDIPDRKDVKVTLTTAYKSMGGAGLTPSEARAAGLNQDGSKKFDSGGLARGLGYMPKRTIAPERVLSPRQTVAFERLVDGLTTTGGGGRGVAVHIGRMEVKDYDDMMRKVQQRVREAELDGLGPAWA